MHSSLRNVLDETRQEEVERSVGSICDKCNTEAFYFNTKNDDLHKEKICLICSEKHARGIILEDFVFSLSNNIPKHYEYVENDLSKPISIGSILSRFTYDNENFIKKLIGLLCKEKPRYNSL